MSGGLPVSGFLTDQTVRRAPRAPERPLVSVVLPTHARRRSGLLERAIASVLTQTLDDLELIVVDDGSTDGTSELVASLAAQDPRIVHVHHQRNSGLPALRVNEGIELARGRYLAFQFDDDSWRPGALARLVEESERRAESTVVVGRAVVRGKGGEWTLPTTELDLVTLHEQNRFANNAALFPRVLADRHGMFDCHVGMRRLCDWDLWLRFLRHVPFVAVDEVVSEVSEGNAGAIGVTVPYDLALFRFVQQIPRDHLLTPARWRDYAVDALQIGPVAFAGELRRRLYEEHVVPFYLKQRHAFPQLEGFTPTLPPARRSVLCTKGSYDVSNDISFSHFDALSSERQRYKLWFSPTAQAGPEWVSEADALVLVRPVEDQARALLTAAERGGVPVAVYLDDDLLNFHELGPQFAYLAPGTPGHDTLKAAIKRADCVWATNAPIRETVEALNPRTVPFRGAVPAASLPGDVRPRDPSRPLRIGYVGSGYRAEEFREIWDGLHRFSEVHRERAAFEFWGLDVTAFPRLASPVTQRPFTFSYSYYLQELRDAEFDVLLTPLLTQPRARLAKCLIKYFETAVAGALGIFSDVRPYRELPAGVTCLKAGNDARAWFDALTLVAEMAPSALDSMRRRCLEHVREDFTETAQIHKFEAALRAAEFHCRTRNRRGRNGRPAVAYVLHSAHLAGAELQLRRRFEIARDYGIEPLVVLPRVTESVPAGRDTASALAAEGIQVDFVDYSTTDRPRRIRERPSSGFEVREYLARRRPALVHTATLNPTFGRACAEAGIPHVASLYQVDERYEDAPPAMRSPGRHARIVHSDSVRYSTFWGRALGSERFCSRAAADERLFELGRRRRSRELPPGGTSPPPVRRIVLVGTLQPRKRQREAVQAVRTLRAEGADCRLDLVGYDHFFPKYREQCEREIEQGGLQDLVRLRGFSEDVVPVLESADVLLCVSALESLPNSVTEAMAAGVLVVATPVGGIGELLLDGVTGILCADTSLEAITDGLRRALRLTPEARERIVEQARRVARSECHPQRIASDLLTMYVRALELAAPAAAAEAVVPPAFAATEAEVKSSFYAAAPPLSHVLVGGGLRYAIEPAADGWEGLDVLVGTHERAPHGAVHLQVRGGDGRVLRQASADLAAARDNDWLQFRYEPIPEARGRRFELQFSLAAPNGTRISVYEANPFEAKWRRMLRRAGLRRRGNRLYYRTWHAG